MATGLFSGWAARDYSGRANADMTSARAAAKAAEAQTEVELMRADVERLLMITEALWSILKEQHGYTDEELMRRVEAVDLRDYNMELIRAKGAKGPILPIQLTPEEDAQLVNEGILPPMEIRPPTPSPATTNSPATR